MLPLLFQLLVAVLVNLNQTLYAVFFLPGVLHVVGGVDELVDGSLAAHWKFPHFRLHLAPELRSSPRYVDSLRGLARLQVPPRLLLSTLRLLNTRKTRLVLPHIEKETRLGQPVLWEEGADALLLHVLVDMQGILAHFEVGDEFGQD